MPTLYDLERALSIGGFVMIAAISNAPAYTGFNSATLLGASSSLNANSLSTSQQALLEAELAIYTQQLAEVQTTGSSVPGALSAQQIQQQITSIQQQLDQLNAGSSVSASSIQSSTVSGNLINTFA